MGLKRKGNGAGRMGSGQGTSAGGRTAKWDNIRGILMLLVVLAHIYNHYTKFSPAVSVSVRNVRTEGSSPTGLG